MTQTLAIFYDAYHGLRARKMFWVVLVISGLVVVSFACIGIGEKGMTFLWWEFESGPSTLDTTPAAFYKGLFLDFGLGLWLTWAGVLLALISTAGIFPSFLTSGTVDLVIARPITRVRLFLTQYVAALLFVTLQITVFSVACFLVIGLRGEHWEPGIFLAIPVVVCMFSYLFSICVLLGVWTRSTLAALLLTILFWVMLFVLHATDIGTLAKQVELQTARARRELRIDSLQTQIHAREADPDNAGARARIPSLQGELRTLQARNTEEASLADMLEMIHHLSYRAKTPLPKTGETILLLQRAIVSVEERPGSPEDWSGEVGPYTDPAVHVMVVMYGRSIAWVLGTSLAYEAVVLALAAWIFCRRDY